VPKSQNFNTFLEKIMAMQLDQVVPFGRLLDEYIKMFQLTAADQARSILSVGDGPASFNAEGTPLGYKITSLDPIYEFSAEQIQQRFDAVVDNIIQQVRDTPNDWVWGYHQSPDDLRQNRERAIALFCADYAQGKVENRYEIGAMPQLSYANQQFDLGLSSHFLFLYSAQLSQQFHIDSVIEMLRVCCEIRIFPLLTLGLERSPHLDATIALLEKQGYICTIETVAYEFQKGGNQMLRVRQR
jgi:hypothetical protein